MPSCSCVSFEKDGADLQKNQWWSLNSDGKSIVGIYSRLPLEARSFKNKCLLVARLASDKSILYRKPLSSTVFVYRDLESHPSAISVPWVGSDGSWKKQVGIKTIVSKGAEFSAPVITLPNDLDEAIEYSLTYEGAEQSAGANFITHSFLLNILPKSGCDEYFRNNEWLQNSQQRISIATARSQNLNEYSSCQIIVSFENTLGTDRIDLSINEPFE